MQIMTSPADPLPSAGLSTFGLSLQEVADYLNVRPKTIRTWITTRGFPKPVRISRKTVRFDLFAVQLWALNNGQPTGPRSE
jgi:predicted DNA-binding transcriptional regulator AlpA